MAADPVAITIVWELRLARTLLAGLAGASLGAAGATLQGLFRNPLADPYSLGVSSGAALGAVLAMAVGLRSPLGSGGGIEASAFTGAILSAALVYGAARSGRRTAATTALLLAGAAVGSFLSAAVSLIVSLNDRDLQRVFFWLLGGFGGKSWPDLTAALVPATASILLALGLARPLDLLGAGEEAASSMGLDLRRARVLAVASSSLGAAAAVSAGGVIGFIGLIGPHIARLIVGPGHRRLIPASALAGAILLMCADAVARSVASPLELPVGVVTALVGAPLFLRLLAKRGIFA
jgi:iron complex transport system permease protein